MVTDETKAHSEFASLRGELLARIQLQNVLLIVCVVIFAALATAAILARDAAWPLAVATNATILAAVLQWCHHGVRTMQIKRYLLALETDDRNWECWLPANRPRTLLGSRWLISTKGVFLGLGLGHIGLVAWVAPHLDLIPAVAAVGLWLAAAGFLFTNPKE